MTTEFEKSAQQNMLDNLLPEEKKMKRVTSSSRDVPSHPRGQPDFWKGKGDPLPDDMRGDALDMPDKDKPWTKKKFTQDSVFATAFDDKMGNVRKQLKYIMGELTCTNDRNSITYVITAVQQQQIADELIKALGYLNDDSGLCWTPEGITRLRKGLETLVRDNMTYAGGKLTNVDPVTGEVH